jgi:hypothetical protein
MKTTLVLAITLTVVVLCPTINAQSPQRPVTIPRPTVESCKAALKQFNVVKTEEIIVIGKYWYNAVSLKTRIKALETKLSRQYCIIRDAEMAAKNIKRKPGESKEARDAAKKKAKEKIAAEKMLLQVLPGQIRQLQVEYDANTKAYKAAVEQLLKALESKK